MKLHGVKECLDVHKSDISGSVYDDVNMSGSTVGNVNLAGCSFKNVNLSGATFEDANCSGWKLNDVNLAGTRSGCEGSMNLSMDRTGHHSFGRARRERGSAGRLGDETWLPKSCVTPTIFVTAQSPYRAPSPLLI